MSLSSRTLQPLMIVRISLGFVLALLVLPAPGFSHTLSCGQTPIASSSTVSEQDTYSMQGVSQAGMVTLRMVKPARTLRPFLELYDATGYTYFRGHSYRRSNSSWVPIGVWNR